MKNSRSYFRGTLMKVFFYSRIYLKSSEIKGKDLHSNQKNVVYIKAAKHLFKLVCMSRISELRILATGTFRNSYVKVA
jgi:hypothetical protein